VGNHIFPKIVQYGVFHRLTGEVIEPLPSVRTLLLALKMGSPVSFCDDDLVRMGHDGQQLKMLIEKELLVTEDHDLLASFLDQYMVRPAQNPAVSYRSRTGELIVVRTSMAQRIFSPAAEELPNVIEERLEPEMAALFLAADGTQTLTEICETITSFKGKDLLSSEDLRKGIEFLTDAKLQLIKFTRNRNDAGNPFRPCNITPRNMYPSSKSDAGSHDVSAFHQRLIDDASMEFDFVEPTINHGFRFPNEALGGLSYGARFYGSALQLLPDNIHGLKVLEVGGGTGSFAAGFIEEASKREYPAINYSIVDLSPALAASQQQRLASLNVRVDHFEQDATQLHIPSRQFDLIISNEVIADFPVASVTRNGNEWQGPGAAYLEKYGLHNEAAPSSFLINTGAIQFLERAWEHLAPGGVFLVSEYGDEFNYPVQAYHLNHEEFSIHFGYLKKCAETIGFECRLMALKDFLNIDDQVAMVGGQEEQILCLNQIFKEHGAETLPFALITEREFKTKYGELAERIELTGVTFSPLSNGFHFGPKLSQFMILVMSKPNQVEIRFEGEATP
jgi:SAM-dependent methyltransferase